MCDLRSGALVLLIIAAADGVIDAIEYYTSVNLWQPLAILGAILFVVDLLIRTRSSWTQWILRKREKPAAEQIPPRE